jgi:hypothetical protein
VADASGGGDAPGGREMSGSIEVSDDTEAWVCIDALGGEAWAGAERGGSDDPAAAGGVTGAGAGCGAPEAGNALESGACKLYLRRRFYERSTASAFTNDSLGVLLRSIHSECKRRS